MEVAIVIPDPHLLFVLTRTLVSVAVRGAYLSLLVENPVCLPKTVYVLWYSNADGVRWAFYQVPSKHRLIISLVTRIMVRDYGAWFGLATRYRNWYIPLALPSWTIPLLLSRS